MTDDESCGYVHDQSSRAVRIFFCSAGSGAVALWNGMLAGWVLMLDG